MGLHPATGRLLVRTRRRCHALATASRTGTPAPGAPDAGHVFTILAHRDSTLAAGCAGFIRGKLVRSALLVRSATPTPGNLPLLVTVHPCKTTPFTPCHDILRSRSGQVTALSSYG